MTIGSGYKQIGQLLLQAGVIDELQLRSALGHQRQWGGRLGRILVELKFIDESSLASTLARQLGLESTRITFDAVHPEVVALVPQTVAERYWIFPLAFQDSKGGGELTVAVSDPTNLAAVEDVRFHTGKRIKVVVAPESDIEGAIKRFYYGDMGAALATSSQGEEVFTSSPTSLSEAEEDLAELDPIPSDSNPSVPAPEISVGDGLDDFFTGLTPPPVSGAAALVDFGVPAPAAPLPPPATQPPSVVLDMAALGADSFGEATPTPIRLEASAFDSPQLSTMFEPTPPGDQPEPTSVELGSFLGEEDEISFGVQALSNQTPSLSEPTEPAAEASYSKGTLAEAATVPGISAPSAAEPGREPPALVLVPASPQPALAVDLRNAVAPPNEGAAFAALAPPLVGTAAVPAGWGIVSGPVRSEATVVAREISPMPIEVVVAPPPELAPPAVSSGRPLPSVLEQPAAVEALGPAPFTESELKIFDTLEARVAGGADPAQVIKPGQLVSALIRLMIRKGVLAEAELIEELQKR